MTDHAAIKLRNSAALAEDVRCQRDRFEGLPEVINLLTSEICNLRCKMCKRSVRPGRRSLDRAYLQSICSDLLPTARRAILAGFQGEPLLRDFDLILQAAIEHEVKIDLTTNGTLLDVDLYRAARGALNLLNISIDSSIPAVYEKIRIGGEFEVVHNNLLAIAEERQRRKDEVVLALTAVVMRSNLNHLDQFVDFAAGVGADAVVFQPLRQLDLKLPDEDIFKDIRRGRNGDLTGGRTDPLRACGSIREQLEKWFAPARRSARRAGINLYFGDFSLPSEETRPLQLKVDLDEDNAKLCSSIMRHFTVVVTGEVYACCHPTDLKLGNVRRLKPREIWNGAPMRRLRRAHFSRRGTAFCNDCLQAPYLKARKTHFIDSFRRSRLAFAHLWNTVRNWTVGYG